MNTTNDMCGTKTKSLRPHPGRCLGLAYFGPLGRYAVSRDTVCDCAEPANRHQIRLRPFRAEPWLCAHTQGVALGWHVSPRWGDTIQSVTRSAALKSGHKSPRWGDKMQRTLRTSPSCWIPVGMPSITLHVPNRLRRHRPTGDHLSAQGNALGRVATTNVRPERAKSDNKGTTS